MKTNMPDGFSISYDGNTYPLQTGDIIDSINADFKLHGGPQDDADITVTAPNGDALKFGPDNQETYEAGVQTAEKWVSDELKSFVSHPARRQPRGKKAVATA